MDNRYKPGRPSNAPRVPPPGTKWCNYEEHFAPIASFTENDSYCQECRRLYNRRAYLERKRNKVRADIVGSDIYIMCDCGSPFGIPESGDWVCPQCEQEWRAVISIKVEHDG